MDYYRLLEEKLDFRFRIDEEDLWVDILERMRSRDIDVVCALQENEAWTDFIIFTEPYIEVPNVIIVQSGQSEALTVEDLEGLRVAVSRDYSVHFYLQDNHPGLNLVPVIDDTACLREVAAGAVDAAVVHLAIASFAMEKERISNIRIAGEIDFRNKLSFGIRSDWPILRDILQKGFAMITEEEHEAVIERWIDIDYLHFYETYEFQLFLSIFIAVMAVASVAFLSIYFWNRTLAVKISEKTRELNETETRYGSLMESIPGVSYRLNNDEDWTVVYISKEIEVLTGFPQSDFTGNAVRSYKSIIHSDDLGQVDRFTREAVEQHRMYNLTYRIIDSSGRVKWVLERGKGNYDKNGGLFELVGVMIDITSKKEAEDQNKALKNYLDDVTNSMPSILIGIDSDLKIHRFNAAARDAAAAAGGGAAGGKLPEVFPWLSGVESAVRSVIEDRQPEEIRNYRNEIDGIPGYFNILVFPLTGSDGAGIRIDDVTEYVRMEELMLQSEKMLSVGGLAAGMAHEINNPLAGMIQNAVVLRNRLGIGEQSPRNSCVAEKSGLELEQLEKYISGREIPRIIDSIMESGKRSSEIVANVLSFARSDDDRRSSHDLQELIARALVLARTDYDLKKKYDFKKIRLTEDYEDDLPPVPCESSKIQQVIINILNNGAWEMQQAGTSEPGFHISLKRDGSRWIRLEISNNGPPIPEDERKRIFEPFFTTKAVGEGTGLGLSLSYFIIVQNHGGELSVESDEGSGVNFILRLPLG